MASQPVEGRNPYQLAVDYLGSYLEGIRFAMKQGHFAANSYRVNQSGTPLDGVRWVPASDWVVRAIRMHGYDRYGVFFPGINQVLFELHNHVCSFGLCLDYSFVRSCLERMEEIVTDPKGEENWVLRGARSY